MSPFSFIKLSLSLLALSGLTAALPASAQNLYVGDNGYIEQFTHDGKDLGVFYKDPIGNHLGHTSGLTFDSSGNLLIISDPKFGIVKLSPTGAYLANIGTGGYYSAIAADAFGNVYAANTNKKTVDKFSASGAALGTFASTGSGNSTPKGLAFDKAGNLYVSISQPDPKKYGAYLNSITKYAPNGTSLGVFATPNLDYQAQSIAFNSAGNLFVGGFNDIGRAGNIQQFSPTGADLGRPIHNFGIYDPLQFAFDAADNLYIDDNGSVLEYNHAGNVVGQGPGGVNVYMNLGISASGIAFAPTAAAVPEASTTVSLGLMLAFGMGGLIASRRKRKSQ